jgi:glycosyltransferase involved in cell wall biosynthesis
VFCIDFSLDDKIFLSDIGAFTIDYKLSRSGLNFVQDLKTLFNLFKKFQQIKPDFVFSYFVKPSIYGTIAAKFAQVPNRIAMLEGLGFTFTQQPEGVALKTIVIRLIQTFLYRIALPLASTVIFLNKDDKEELLIKNRVRVKRSDVLGGIGVDLEEFFYQKPYVNKLKFLFIGRLYKEKGVNEFLAAAEFVKNINPDVEFILIGGHDSTSPNSLRVDKLKSVIDKGIINYVGQVPSVSEWIAQSSVFVLPSYREGVPRSTQEALAVGRPIITTDVPGCRDTVINGKNGFLISPFDSQAIADKMIWFINNSNEIEKMGIISRKIAETKFDVHAINEKLFRIMGIGK